MRPNEVDPNGKKNHNVRADGDQKSRNHSEDRFSSDDGGSIRDALTSSDEPTYQRSSQLIFEEATEALRRARDLDSRHIDLSVEEGLVTLIGEVETRELKKLAEDCVEHITGVTDVMNNIKVRGTGNFMKDQGHH